MTITHKTIFVLTCLLAFYTTPVLSQKIDAKIDLELLFEAELKAIGEVKPYIEYTDPKNWIYYTRISKSTLIAQGEGVFKGQKMKGTLDWSQTGLKYIKDSHSRSTVVGWMETNDGAEIMYLAEGFGLIQDSKYPEKWTYTATLRFSEADKGYEWLNNVYGLWVGEFNLSTGIATYKAYIPKKKTLN